MGPARLTAGWGVPPAGSAKKRLAGRSAVVCDAAVCLLRQLLVDGGVSAAFSRRPGARLAALGGICNEHSAKRLTGLL